MRSAGLPTLNPRSVILFRHDRAPNVKTGQKARNRSPRGCHIAALNLRDDEEDFTELSRSMNFRQVAVPFVAAFIIAVAIWAALGPPPSPQKSVLKDKRQFAGPL